MRYIGSKRRISNQIYEKITKHSGSLNYYAEPFAGTGAVGKVFAEKGWSVNFSDALLFPITLLGGKVGRFSKVEVDCANSIIDELNEDRLPENANFTFFLDNFSEQAGRLHFSVENAIKIDALIQEVRQYSSNIGKLVKSSLIEAISDYANNTGVFAAYLKKLTSRASEPFQLKHVAPIVTTSNIFQSHGASSLLGKSFDVIYLDPPYNGRDYLANYAPLECAALALENKELPTVYGKSGLVPYTKSKFCSKETIEESFAELIHTMSTAFAAFSYSEDGILQKDTLLSLISSKFDILEVATIEVGRYNSGSGVMKAPVKEWLIIAEGR